MVAVRNALKNGKAIFLYQKIKMDYKRKKWFLFVCLANMEKYDPMSQYISEITIKLILMNFSVSLLPQIPECMADKTKCFKIYVNHILDITYF